MKRPKLKWSKARVSYWGAVAGVKVVDLAQVRRLRMPLLRSQPVEVELNLVLDEVEAQLGPGGQVEHFQNATADL